ncbi:MAG: MATE family efflux transporter [Lachnospiraceae bacterium]|nr:MATE family efflux transporter [Lachnospiraceae bacterium]
MNNSRKIQLSDHFTVGRMIRFAMPSIGTMIFTSIYGVVDGFFVSNYAGAVPFASLNLAMPFIMILSAVGFMFGSGGTALVSMLLGMKKPEKANEIFSLLTYIVLGGGIALGVFGFITAPGMVRILGATAQMEPYAVLYIRISMFGLPFFMLQNMFQSFFITAERPKLGFAVTIVSGFTNMVLDLLFVGFIGFGLGGAAAATIISEMVGGAVPLVYFFRKNSSTLRLGKTHMDRRAVIKACTNGSSEFLTNCATSVVSMLYNLQLMKYMGSDGVAAYGVIMYVNFIFAGIYYGYTMAMAPVIGYNYGALNHPELRNLFRTSIRMFTVVSVVLTIAAELMAPVLVKVFVGYDIGLYSLTKHAFRIYTIAYLFMGFNIFGSGFFTALNNGGVSALLSVTRTLILQLIAIYLLPALFGADGLWCAVMVSNGLCLILTVCMWIKYQKKYGY